VSETINREINIGSENEITILELAKTIKEIVGSNSRIMHLPPLKEGDMRKRRPDNTLMKKYLINFKEVDFFEGLQRTIRFFDKPGRREIERRISSQWFGEQYSSLC